MIFSKLCNTKLFSSLSSSSSPSHHNPAEAPTLQTLLKSGFTPTLKDFNQFLLFLSQTHKFKSLIHFFSQMESNNIKGNAHSHSIFTWAVLKEHKYEEAEQLMKTQMVDSSLLKKNRIWDCLIQGFCVNRKDPEKALLVLRDCLRIDEGPSLESAKDFNELKAISSLGHLNSQKLDPSRLGIHSGPLNDQLLALPMGIGVKFSWWCLKLKATHHSLLFD